MTRNKGQSVKGVEQCNYITICLRSCSVAFAINYLWLSYHTNAVRWTFIFDLFMKRVCRSRANNRLWISSIIQVNVEQVIVIRSEMWLPNQFCVVKAFFLIIFSLSLSLSLFHCQLTSFSDLVRKKNLMYPSLKKGCHSIEISKQKQRFL